MNSSAKVDPAEYRDVACITVFLWSGSRAMFRPTIIPGLFVCSYQLDARNTKKPLAWLIPLTDVVDEHGEAKMGRRAKTEYFDGLVELR